MRIISALFNTTGRDYLKMAEGLRASAAKAGHLDVVVYPLREDPIEEFVNKVKYKTSCFFKPGLILKALDDTKHDLIWLDMDCIVKENLDGILGDADVAVTLRRGQGLRDIYDGYLNAGVMAFRNNQASRDFVQAWIKNIPGSRADQDALNKTLMDDLVFAAYNEVIVAAGARIMVRSCDEYNFFYFPESNSAKVYHVKGSLREQFYQTYLDEVLSER